MRRRERPVTHGTGQVPPALFDYRDPVWQTADTARAWCLTHQLPADATDITGARLHRAAQHRRQTALRAWALANGLESKKYPGMIDCHQLTTLHLTAAGSPTGPCPPRPSPSG